MRAWQQRTFSGGRHRLIKELLAEGTHTLESWGNAKEGWWPYLVCDGAGISIGPHFCREYGDTLRDLKEAAARAYGVKPGDVKRGRNY